MFQDLWDNQGKLFNVPRVTSDSAVQFGSIKMLSENLLLTIENRNFFFSNDFSISPKNPQLDRKLRLRLRMGGIEGVLSNKWIFEPLFSFTQLFMDYKIKGYLRMIHFEIFSNPSGSSVM